MIIDHNRVVLNLPYEEIIEQSITSLFYVDLDIIINPLGFAFKAGSGHPFTETMVAYKNQPALGATQTPMHAFYERFQPKTLHEAFFDYPTTESSIFKQSPKTYQVPWLTAIPMGGFGQNLDSTHGSHFLGPVSQTFVRNEYARLCAIYDSIYTNGFDVEKQTDTIRGYFLRHHNGYRFIIVGGNHRVGVLSALNNKRIPVALHQERPSVIDREHLMNADNLHGFTPLQARALFDALFTMRQSN